MFCRNCGNKIIGEGGFCPMCGEAVILEGRTEGRESEKKLLDAIEEQQEIVIIEENDPQIAVPIEETEINDGTIATEEVAEHTENKADTAVLTEVRGIIPENVETTVHTEIKPEAIDSEEFILKSESEEKSKPGKGLGIVSMVLGLWAAAIAAGFVMSLPPTMGGVFLYDSSYIGPEFVFYCICLVWQTVLCMTISSAGFVLGMVSRTKARHAEMTNKKADTGILSSSISFVVAFLYFIMMITLMPK